jgi:hypothetical protein
MTKTQNSKPVLNIRILDLEFVSDLEIRISDLELFGWGASDFGFLEL